MDKINNNYFFLNPEIKNTDDQKKTKKSSTIARQASLFQKMLMQEEEHIEPVSENKNELNDEIANLLKDISAKGRNLKKYKKVEDLEDYKKLIQSLLKKVVSSTEKVEKKATFRNGQKNFKLHLQIINKNLLELTREFMKQQKSVIAIATKIDSIEGLLLDLLS
ncbi:MAG: YaaR family protein [Spirochaetales bacterium]|nr:YaaR family protein [Spirochaetales bacterium]